MPQQIPISAAGKVLSGSNQKKLVESVLGILKVLVSNEHDFSTIADFIEDLLGKDKTSQEDSNTTSIEAGQLSDNVKVATWFDGVYRSLAMFRENFINLYRMNDSQVERDYGVGIARIDVANDLIGDLTLLLSEYKENFPGKGDENYYYYPHYDGFYASAKPRAVEAAQAPTEPVPQEPPLRIQAGAKAEINILGIVSTQDVIEGQHDKNVEFHLGFRTIQVQEVLAFKQQGNANTVPFEGVLFIIDEPSESAPAKGSSFPLYVPMEVAVKAAAALNASGGLPLDMDESLSCHSDTNIVGVMTSAEIKGKNFVVQGHLFARNQAERVALIANNKDSLGMSMNAFASGVVKTIDGVTAYEIETLELLGANILLADKATWQKTQVLAAQAATNSSSEEIDMDLEKLQAQLNEISANMNKVVTAQSSDRERVDTLQKTVDRQNEILAQQGQILQEIAAERQQNRLETESREKQAQIEASNKQLAEIISNSLNTSLKEFQKNVLDQINPNRSPRALTTRPAGLMPVVAGADPSNNSSEIKLSPEQYQLLQAQSQLAGMEKSRHTGPDRVKLIETCRLLRAQGVALPAGMSHQTLLTSVI